MIFQSPGDVLFTISGFSIYNYGIILAIASFVGVFTSYLIFKKYNPEENYEFFWDFAAYVLIIGFLGARLYYCALNPVYYFHNPLEILNFREGGLSIHGGIIFGILALVILSKKYKLPFLNVLDSFVCGTAIAQCIGRWGNFFNSEAFGYPTDLPWKLFIPASQRPPQYIGYEYFHPTFLYESILDFCIFITLIMLMKKFAKTNSGLVLFVYLILYSSARLIVESLRIDSALNISGIPIAKIMSIVLIIIGIIGIAIIINKKYEKI